MKTLTWILAVIGLFGTLFSLVKYVFLCSLRLDDALGQALIQFLAADSRKRYIVSQEISLRDVKSMPRLFGALFWDRGLVGYLSREYHQSDFNRFSSYHVCRVVCPRAMRNRMIGYMRSISEPRAGDISVTLIGHAQEDCTLGFIDESKIDPPLLDPDEYLDIEEAVEHSLRTGSRIGLFLHGPPGIGKTSFVRYLAKRFTLPINVVAFTPEVNNQDILKLFSRVPRDSIILMEDVDNYLDGRKVSIGRGGQAKFSFDAIVNAIDGVYREYAGNVIVMTANDIMGIDSALVDRRGRFAFVRRFRDPSYERRRLFFGGDELAAATEGMNADRCYFVRRRIEIYGRARGLEMLRSGDPELAVERPASSY